MTMPDPVEVAENLLPRRIPWNKGKLIGPKPPLRPKHVWSIRTRLQVEGRTRDLAMFNLAIDSKLRGCDVVAIKVEDVAPHHRMTVIDLQVFSGYISLQLALGAWLATHEHDLTGLVPRIGVM